jgi:hypothetical protein
MCRCADVPCSVAAVWIRPPAVLKLLFCLQENDARIRQVSTLMTGVCGKLDQKFMEQIAGASSRVTRCHQVDLPRV